MGGPERSPNHGKNKEKENANGGCHIYLVIIEETEAEAGDEKLPSAVSAGLEYPPGSKWAKALYLITRKRDTVGNIQQGNFVYVLKGQDNLECRELDLKEQKWLKFLERVEAIGGDFLIDPESSEFKLIRDLFELRFNLAKSSAEDTDEEYTRKLRQYPGDTEKLFLQYGFNEDEEDQLDQLRWLFEELTLFLEITKRI